MSFYVVSYNASNVFFDWTCIASYVNFFTFISSYQIKLDLNSSGNVKVWFI